MNKFYIPFYYLIHSRLKSKIDQISWLIIFIVPQLIFTIYFTDYNIFLVTILFLISQLTFNTLYENGYLENDIKTTLNEKNPTKRISQNEYDFLAKNYNSLIYSRYFIIIVSLIFIYFISKYYNQNINFIAFTILLLVNRLFFYLHNINRNRINLVTFSILAVTKYIFPIVLLVNNENAILICLFIAILFPLIRIIEHSTHKRYNYIKYANLVGNHDKFRIIYYSTTTTFFTIFYLIDQDSNYILFLYLSVYFLLYRIASFLMIKKNIYKRDKIKNKDLQVKD